MAPVVFQPRDATWEREGLQGLGLGYPNLNLEIAYKDTNIILVVGGVIDGACNIILWFPGSKGIFYTQHLPVRVLFEP